MTDTLTPTTRRRRSSSTTRSSSPASPTVLGHTVEAKVSRVSQVPAGPLRETAARALDDGLHVWLVRHDGRLGVLVTNPGAPVAAWSS